MIIQSLLMYCTWFCNESRVLEHLKQIVPEIYILTQKCKNKDLDPELAQALFQMIHTNKADAVFSMDYYPIVAEVAHIVGIPYIAWVVDAPHFTLYSSTTFYDNVYIFHFDREEARRLEKLGRPHIYHLSLATDPAYFQKVIRNSKERAYTDITLLASSYKNKYDYFEQMKALSDYDRGFCEGLMRVQSSIPMGAIIQEAVPEELQERLLGLSGIAWPETYDIPKRLAAGSILEKKLSVREREKIVNIFAQNFGITLYSEANEQSQERVCYKGFADYETEMPLVFYYSKINLNPTLRTIHSGIPLRALDIMACGGFLLSNIQPELTELFEDGVSLAFYGDEEEMIDKAEWYLAHDTHRIAVTKQGYDIVRKHFTYSKVLKRMFCQVAG